MKKNITRRTVSSTLIKPDCNIPIILQHLYHLRGITSCDQIDYNLAKLPNYEKLTGMVQAVTLLQEAIATQAHIVIVGDFDADGATATALAVLALKSMGAKQVTYQVPDRFTLGYGLTVELVELVAQRSPDLLITVDNGITYYDGVCRAKELGMKVIITDHHLPGIKIPPAEAIVNPHLAEADFPCKKLAGVGVIFYVMAALRARLKQAQWFSQQQMPEPNLANFLDLVALGTIADLVPLDYCNRLLVMQGINRIQNRQCRPGILALLQLAKRDPGQVSTQDLAFQLGPRINAAGRLAEMTIGIECLLSEEIQTAYHYAEQLDQHNQNRREIEGTMMEKALNTLDEVLNTQKDPPLGISLFADNWHEGVVGLVASRIREQFSRPAIAFAPNGVDRVKGSGRSIPAIHLRDVLADIDREAPGLIERFGGHAMAIGLQMKREHLAAFQEHFNRHITQLLDGNPLEGLIESDGSLAAEHFNTATARMLKASGPWGQGFPAPLFDGLFIVLEDRPLKEPHRKLIVIPQETPSAMPLEALLFNAPSKGWQSPVPEGKIIHLAYQLDVNSFRDSERVQLLVEYGILQQ